MTTYLILVMSAVCFMVYDGVAVYEAFRIMYLAAAILHGVFCFYSKADLFATFCVMLTGLVPGLNILSAFWFFEAEFTRKDLADNSKDLYDHLDNF